jgi:hypothetical protein
VFGYQEQHVDFAGRAPEFEMLFDLAADPGERANLAAAPEHRALLAELRRKCAAQSVAINQRREEFKKSIEVQRRAAPAPKKGGKAAKK